MKAKIAILLTLVITIVVLVVVKDPVLVKIQANRALDDCGEGNVSEVSVSSYSCKN
jgi:hypothetical protein